MGMKFSGPTVLASAVLGVGIVAFGILTASPPNRPAPAVKTAAAERAAASASAPANPVYRPGADAAPAAGSAAAGAQIAAATPPAPVDENLVIKRVLPIKGPIKYGQWHWDDADVPAGPIAISVDLDARVISVFRGGYEIGAAAVLLGTQEKPTPTGVFPIMSKARHHTSNLYDAPMPYMQRLTNDGISLHATKVEWGYASHGCIGMPEAFAAKVFQQTSVGDRVFITRAGKVSAPAAANPG